jgi:hypothetical protein
MVFYVDRNIFNTNLCEIWTIWLSRSEVLGPLSSFAFLAFGNDCTIKSKNKRYSERLVRIIKIECFSKHGYEFQARNELHVR